MRNHMIAQPNWKWYNWWYWLTQGQLTKCIDQNDEKKKNKLWIKKMFSHKIYMDSKTNWTHMTHDDLWLINLGINWVTWLKCCFFFLFLSEKMKMQQEKLFERATKEEKKLFILWYVSSNENKFKWKRKDAR